MNKKTTNILFTCAGRRNYLINYFKEVLKGDGKIFAGDYQKDAPSLIDADVAIQMPRVDDINYITFLKKICTENAIDAVISLNDLELPLLSKHKKELENNGQLVIISDSSVIEIAFDKWQTYEFLKSNKFKTPKTYISLKKAIIDLSDEKINFPLVLKPRWGSGSINIDIVETLEELDLAYRLQKIKLSRTILADVSKSTLDESILIQEKINGTEYGMDILNDLNTDYIGSFAREKLSMRSGETDKAKSVIKPELEEVGEKISKNLKHIGNLDIDVFVNDLGVYVLELNPRFGGGYPFSHQAGINTAAIYIEWIKGNTSISKFINYRENIAFSKCDRLIQIKNI
ncbi:MAG: ATP-grasp domain-containing protein [Cellulophaga sp.]|nr:ATP-grasp domain-containing protein [Cellulophaga sp.]